MLFSIFNIIGCSFVDKEQAADVTRLLHDKYNQDFVVTHIGERFGTASGDTVTTYVHPVGQEELVFKALTGKDGTLKSDSYIPRIISQQLNEILKNELLKQGIESESFVFAMNTDSSAETDPSISLEQYVARYKPEYFAADMIVRENANAVSDHVVEALKAVYQSNLKTTFQVWITFIADEEFDAGRDSFIRLPSISEGWYNDYTIVDEWKAVIDEKGQKVIKVDAGRDRDGE